MITERIFEHWPWLREQRENRRRGKPWPSLDKEQVDLPAVYLFTGRLWQRAAQKPVQAAMIPALWEIAKAGYVGQDYYHNLITRPSGDEPWRREYSLSQSSEAEPTLGTEVVMFGGSAAQQAFATCTEALSLLQRHPIAGALAHNLEQATNRFSQVRVNGSEAAVFRPADMISLYASLAETSEAIGIPRVVTWDIVRSVYYLNFERLPELPG